MASADLKMTQLIYEFPSHFIENVHTYRNHLLLTSLSSGSLYVLNPNEASPTAKAVVDLPGSTGLSGIASIGPDLFAISGGIHGHFKFDDMFIYVVSVSQIQTPSHSSDENTNDRPSNGYTGIVMKKIPMPHSKGLNGMASLPSQRHIILSADSHNSCIYRINTMTSMVDIAISDPAMGPGPDFAIGINGLRILPEDKERGRACYAYFTNSGQGLFARVELDGQGTKKGDVEVIARLDEQGGRKPGMSHAYDDFCFDGTGKVAYVTLHMDRVVRIGLDGETTAFVGGKKNHFSDEDTKEVAFRNPTSAALAEDGRSIFVVTGGIMMDENGNRVSNGQVIRVGI